MLTAYLSFRNQNTWLQISLHQPMKNTTDTKRKLGIYSQTLKGTALIYLIVSINKRAYSGNSLGAAASSPTPEETPAFGALRGYQTQTETGIANPD